MTLPHPSAQAILQAIVDHIRIGAINPSDPHSFLGYMQVHEALGLQKQGDTIGNSLKVQGLAQLAEWTKDEKHPAITGMIVDKSRESDNYLTPGEGYFRLFGKKYPDDYAWWIDQLTKSMSYDWQPFLAEKPRPHTDAHKDSQWPARLLVHICIADPSLHLTQIEKAAHQRTNRFDWWNINKHAKPGETVIFYMTAPVSAFIACGVIGQRVADGEVDESSPWYGSHCFWINEPQMLARRLTLQEAKKHLPSWNYLKHPVVTSLPDGRTPIDVIKRFLELLRLPVPSTEEARDLPQPPDRIPSTIYRILRDTDLARQVKKLHGYKCQICGHVIQLPNGSLYAEAHHIQPLGQPHDGHDVIGNILCLCPNHHAEFDYGVSPLNMPELRTADGHIIDQKYVEYHNRFIYNSSRGTCP